jgi:hypothetical protein
MARLDDLNARRGAFQIMGVLAFGGDFDPTLGPVGAFLHGREIDHRAHGEGIGDAGTEDEFVVVLVQKLAGPDDFLDALGQLRSEVVVSA